MSLLDTIPRQKRKEKHKPMERDEKNKALKRKSNNVCAKAGDYRAANDVEGNKGSFNTEMLGS